jgi:hypothetical protein
MPGLRLVRQRERQLRQYPLLELGCRCASRARTLTRSDPVMPCRNHGKQTTATTIGGTVIESCAECDVIVAASTPK